MSVDMKPISDMNAYLRELESCGERITYMGSGWQSLHQVNTSSPVQGQQPQSLPLYWLESTSLVTSEPIACWRCRKLMREYAIGFHLVPRDSHLEQIWRIIPLSYMNRIVPFTSCFLNLLKNSYSIDFVYSQKMNKTYLGQLCPHCHVLHGENFIFRNYMNRGGMFSHPQYSHTKIYWAWLPRIADTTYRVYSELTADDFTVNLDPHRIQIVGFHNAYHALPFWKSIPDFV